jgi:hypothetical protein
VKTVILRTNTSNGDVRVTLSDNTRELHVHKITLTCGVGAEYVGVLVYRDSGRRTAEGLEMWVPQPCAAV